MKTRNVIDASQKPNANLIPASNIAHLSVRNRRGDRFLVKKRPLPGLLPRSLDTDFQPRNPKGFASLTSVRLQQIHTERLRLCAAGVRISTYKKEPIAAAYLPCDRHCREGIRRCCLAPG